MDRGTFDKLLLFGVEKGASDVHFEVGAAPYYRIKGDLLKARYNALEPAHTKALADLLIGDRDIDLDHVFPEQDTSYSITGVSRFRASVFRQRGSIGLVLRVIPFEIPKLEDLNLPPVIGELSKLRRGLVLVTGATGNGKSTTVAALLQLINDSRLVHIITIEDPIEFLFSNSKAMIIQREVGTDTYSFKDGLTAALRQDPDVIMVGEIRDESTAKISLKAAETGHLVVSTLHTPDVPSTIKRFYGFFDAAHASSEIGRVADALQAVVSLRLLPKADGTGVIPAVEIMRVTHTLQELIRDVSRHQEILSHVEKGKEMYNMQTFDQHLVELVRQGVVDQKVAQQAASKPADFERALMME